MGTPRWLAAALLLASAAWPALAQQADARAADANARTTGTQAPPPYGPVLYVNGKPVADTGAPQRDPAEVHDEADTGANPATPAAAPQHGSAQQQRQQQQRPATRRHPAS